MVWSCKSKENGGLIDSFWNPTLWSVASLLSRVSRLGIGSGLFGVALLYSWFILDISGLLFGKPSRLLFQGLLKTLL